MATHARHAEKGNHMVKQYIVPVDNSTESWRAFDVARSFATRSNSQIRIVHVASEPLDGRLAKSQLQLEIDQRGPFDFDVSTDVRLAIGTVAAELETVMALHPGAIMVMSSHGKGRSAAIVGSITEDILQRTFGPIVLVGPKAESNDFTGPIIVTVDGSNESEVALPLAAAWAIELGTTPLILSVADPKTAASSGHNDVLDTAYPARLADGLRSFSAHAVEFDELHDKHPDRAVVDYATRHDASLIVASSHGRSGLSRLAMGSITASFVRNATCPVVVVRLPNPSRAEAQTRMWAY
ncbi:MAG: nucleotide-binding universal stress UspA family protein [Ilumatobacter sp.]|jgi:nucleotide-binding universal stress UspA family protein